MDITSAMGKAIPITTRSFPYNALKVVARASLQQKTEIEAERNAAPRRARIKFTLEEIGPSPAVALRHHARIPPLGTCQLSNGSPFQMHGRGIL